MNITYELPQITEYIELRLNAGLPRIEESIAETALRHSIITVLVRDDNAELMGMGRVVGDGAFYFQIVDILIAPTIQENGIDDILLKELLACLEERAPKATEVTVMTDLPGIKLYQNAGFKLVYPDRYGMSKIL